MSDKVFLFLAALLLITFPFATVSGENRPAVIVELFTSEACSSCPAADELLSKLREKNMVHGAEVLTLGEHVDYFNHTGWSDRFSSRLFTERQTTYATRFHLAGPYTPQMVIDGHLEALGSDATSVENEIDVAAKSSKTASVSLNWTEQNRLNVTVSGAPGEPYAVMLAVSEDGLTTRVSGGENGGRTLRHSSVVRALRQLGLTSGGAFSATAPITARPDWKTLGLKIVVFVQKPGGGAIIGAAAVSYNQILRKVTN